MKMNIDIKIDYQRDALRLVQSFVKEKLSNDISKLATFDLASIRDDKKYGNSDKHQGIEQMRICKAIYALIGNIHDKNLTYDKLLFGRGYRMRLMSTVEDMCHYLGVPNEEALHLFNLPIDTLEGIDEYKSSTYTIANVYVEKIPVKGQ